MTEPVPRRRFVTRADVDDAAAAARPIVLGERDVLTHEAANRARQLGVAVQRGPEGVAPGAGGTPAARSSGADARLRSAVRAAVIAELGREPAGLDAAIDRVMSRGV